jgi:uncharacterized protein (TIGR00730 family)
MAKQKSRKTLEFLKEARSDHFRVAIFGSARIRKGDTHYKMVYNLAKMVGKEGMDIVTGGGPGLMKAANSGHQAGKKGKKTHSIGLNIWLPTEQKINRHLDVKKEFHKFSKRLDYFMQLSSIVVVAPGGVGTLLELFYTWQLVQVKHICDIPIILVGEMWVDLIKWIKKWPQKNRFLTKEDLNLLFVVKNEKEAIKLISAAFEEYKKGGKNICLNIKKYKN